MVFKAHRNVSKVNKNIYQKTHIEKNQRFSEFIKTGTIFLKIRTRKILNKTFMKMPQVFKKLFLNLLSYIYTQLIIQHYILYTK